MLNPNDPPHVQIEKQSRIIDALMRRANRQQDVGPSAFRAFQSAIELRQKVEAQSRDLARAATELESARFEQEQTRRNLAEALSSMEQGFALFTDGRLDLLNERFRIVLPDIADQVAAGQTFSDLAALFVRSTGFVSSDKPLALLLASTEMEDHASVSTILELSNDRWHQLTVHRTSATILVALLTDITALVRKNRIEKETLIDLQADYLQAVFQNMTPGVCTFSYEGKVIMHNGGFRDLLGLPGAALEAGTPIGSILRRLYQENLVEHGELRALETWRVSQRGGDNLNARFRHSSGRILDIKANRVPDGGFVVELNDVTLEARTTELLERNVSERTAELTRANELLLKQNIEMARVEEELRLEKERAEAAVSSKTRFLAAASHDLLQPINAAMLLISVLHKKTRKSDVFPLVERLEGAFGSAKNLLHSLLDISRLESPDKHVVKPMEMNLSQILESAHTDQLLLAEQKQVRLDVVQSSLLVRSDPVYLLRSLQNLVVNAVQYTKPGGRVLLGVRRRGDQKVSIEVWDTGVGIAPDDQKRIFEEFARADSVEPGTGMGLGLSVVDRACKHLGHRLTVRSEPGRGSVFAIELDRVDKAPRPIKPLGPLVQTDSDPLNHLVLVLENDARVLDSMVLWLEDCGASVLPASTVHEALRHIEDIGMPPDIVLADYHLDGPETGLDAIAMIREASNAQVPAILITANVDDRLGPGASDKGISVMAKPAKLARLRALIHWKIQWHKEARYAAV